MSPDSVNPVAESVEQLSAQEDVASEVKNPRNSIKNDHPKKRRDKGTFHTTHFGLLSRPIVRALVRSGESLRSIRRYEKKFRSVFKPRGVLGEIIFDRCWSSHLRLYLYARLEAKVLVPGHSHRRSPVLPELREGDLPSLVTPSDLAEFDIAQKFDSELSEDLFRGLALAQRYDAHHSREEYRAAGLLLLMRKGGEAALLKIIGDGLKFAKIKREGK